MKGCDGSILISSKPGSGALAEKDAYDNRDLAAEAFESVRKAKALVESKCPGVVSCADILVIAARDFVHLVKCQLILFYTPFSSITITESLIRLLPLNFEPSKPKW